MKLVIAFILLAASSIAKPICAEDEAFQREEPAPTILHKALPGKEDQAAITEHEISSSLSIRRLRRLQGARSCSYEGQPREPGQWLQGSTFTCMCDREGTRKWVGCVRNEALSVAHAGGNIDDSAFGRRQKFSNGDFVFDLLGAVPESITPGGSIQVANVNSMPALAGAGVSYTLFTLQACGINLPHVHPRATEFIYVINGKGKDLRTAFVEENGGRVVVNEIGIGETTFFPEGLMHYQQNLGCESVSYLSALNSEDPGVVTIATQFFQLPKEAQQATLGEPNETVQQLVHGLPRGPGEGQTACLQRCGLQHHRNLRGQN